MSGIAGDLRFALRSLRRSRGFSVATAVTLGLGMGLATAALSLLQGIVLRQLPYPAADRLFMVWETDPHNDSFRETLSGPDLVDLRVQAKSFDAIGALSWPQFNLRSPAGPPQRVTGGAATATLLPMLGARPAIGRLFSADEDRSGGPRVVVLGHALWQRSFGGDQAVPGRTIHLDGQPYEVVGVLPADFRFHDAELFVPLSAATAFLDVRGVHNIQTVARLRAGTHRAAAQSEVDAIGAALARAHPDDNVGRGFRLEPLREAIVGSAARELWILAGAVGLLLLISCANAAGLWLVRAQGRRREIAVRTALGAGRRHLLGQLVSEALVLSAASSLLALGVAQLALRGLLALRRDDLPAGLAVGLEPRALALAAGCAFLTALLFGVAPLAGGRAVSAALGKSAAGSPLRPGARGALVVAEVALAVMLVSGTTLLARSVWQLLHVEPGFTPGMVTSFGIQLPDARYPMP